MKSLALSLIFVLSVPFAVQARADSPDKSGLLKPSVIAWGRCAETTVRSVTPRLMSSGQTTFTRQDLINSGVEVTFYTHIGVGSGWAEVVHYQQTAGNNIMMNERKGERVRVCFLGGPSRSQYCDPSKD